MLKKCSFARQGLFIPHGVTLVVDVARPESVALFIWSILETRILATPQKNFAKA
jgi:hypothetical protein